MQRRILIIDDHDDLASALEEVFVTTGHQVEVVENRHDALEIEDIERFDLIVTDLDYEEPRSDENGTAVHCLPEPDQKLHHEQPGEQIKAFKLCASNFRRDEFNEEELKNFI